MDNKPITTVLAIFFGVIAAVIVGVCLGITTLALI